MFGRLKGVAVGCAALAIASTALYAAGNYSAYPIVEGGSFCLSTVGVNGQAGITGQGGGAAGTNGAYCAQTVPAGPPAVTGSELVPADTGLAGGAPPQTVVLQMANLNALPITVTNGTTVSSQVFVTAVNTTGGYIINSGGTISAVKVNLPPAPVDGQQFAFSADQIITTLLFTSPTAGVTISNAATALTPSNTAAFGYRLLYNAAANNWYRMQ